MKMIDLGEGWYVNPMTITFICPHRGKSTTHKSEIKFDDGRSVYTGIPPEAIAAQAAAADSGIEEHVRKLIDLTKKNDALLELANARVQELTDRLALFELELKALRAIGLPSP